MTVSCMRQSGELCMLRIGILDTEISGFTDAFLQGGRECEGRHAVAIIGGINTFVKAYCSAVYPIAVVCFVPESICLTAANYSAFGVECYKQEGIESFSDGVNVRVVIVEDTS